jgi:hypothetical protein
LCFWAGDCSHEQDPFDYGSSAAGSAIGDGLAILLGMGRKACGGFLADALYGDEDLDGLSDRLTRGAQSLDVGFDRLDLRIEAFDERLEIRVDGLGGGGGATIGVGEAILDEVASSEDQRLQALSLGLSGAPQREFGVAVEPVSGKRGCVDRIVLLQTQESEPSILD